MSAAAPSGASRAAAEVRGLARGTREVLAGRDLGAAAATLTYYAGIAVVPWLLLAVWTTTWWWGTDGAERRLSALRVLVPDDMGGRMPYDELVRAGTHLGLVGALIVLFPASFYGEGLRRAALALAPAPDRFTGWRGRALVMVPLVVLPGLAWVFFAVGERMVPLSPEGGGGGATTLVIRVLVGFTLVWLVLSPLLAWTFRYVVPGRPRWWVAVLGGLATGSCLAGFLHGFQLFLAIPIDVGIPFGGLGVVGGVVAVGLWLFVLHLCLLLGWATTTALEARAARGSVAGGEDAP
ncbi:YhjD/YihY/BrkB family envelope integrity protein [uncultured Nocardioides sp.]|uniref:YhjD/YihY/BrkB family envelope integrity protein n=1 Tax=uncultured Nocardioides sp. TaxID=198441 RepID=UPI0026033AFF|nr:YhjD/YihY/BrkB family envelope integrity protein [uncultured Nocardioides sp.]